MCDLPCRQKMTLGLGGKEKTPGYNAHFPNFSAHHERIFCSILLCCVVVVGLWGVFFPLAQLIRGRTDLSGDLVLGPELAADLGAGQDVLAVLVELELGDDDVGGVDAQGHGLAGGLVAGDALDVDDVSEAVDGGDLALAALVGAADDGDLVVLADGDAADLLGRVR